VGTAHHGITNNSGLTSRNLLCYRRRMNETKLIQGRLILASTLGAGDKFDILYIYIAMEIKKALHHPTADRHRGHTYSTERYTHNRTIRPAIVSFKVIRAADPELAVPMVGGAHPTSCNGKSQVRTCGHCPPAWAQPISDGHRKNVLWCRGDPEQH
jgi:hypothetical protein